jgi:hypothetical protein
VQQLFGRKILALISRVQLGPVFEKLIAAVLRRVQRAIGRQSDADCIPDSSCVTVRRCECLVQLVRVEAPDAAARLELGARLVAGRLESAVPYLARVGGRAGLHEETSARVDHE